MIATITIKGYNANNRNEAAKQDFKYKATARLQRMEKGTPVGFKNIYRATFNYNRGVVGNTIRVRLFDSSKVKENS